jgi:hypothetical protein
MFAEGLSDELSREQKKWFFHHIETCPVCGAEYQRMTQVVQTMKRRTLDEPEAAFWDNYWDSLEEKLSDRQRTGLPLRTWWQQLNGRVRFQPQLAYRFAVGAALIAVGVLIGKFYFGDSVPTPQIPVMQAQRDTSAQHVALETRTNRYLDRSKILLLGLVNFDTKNEDTYALDIPYQKQISQDLVQEADYLKDQLTDPAQQQVRELIINLEMILLQIANFENVNDLVAIDVVKSGVDETGILLKINLDMMNRQGQLPGTTPEQKKINQIHI